MCIGWHNICRDRNIYLLIDQIWRLLISQSSSGQRTIKTDDRDDRDNRGDRARERVDRDNRHRDRNRDMPPNLTRTS